MAAAARHFTKKLASRVSETTVQSIKSTYLKSLQQKRGNEDEGEISSLPLRKRGRPPLLGEELDMKVELYLRKVRQSRGAVSARILMAAARGILLKCDRTKLAEFGGHVELKRNWANSLLTQMKFVQ